MNAPRDFDRPRRSRIATAVAFAFVLLAAVPGGFATAAPQSSSSSASSGSAVFSSAELDQMLAPIALYPDSLLAQVLMASTYPGEVADAVAWSKANPNAKGDDAVKQVASKPWDPSVQALVAFPQVLASLGQNNDWVTRLGDAFLAEPDRVTQSIQRLRAEAQKAGTLKSSEQQTVKTEAVSGGSSPTAIVIESNDPDVIYVPSYDPSWAYPGYGWGAYPPYYYPPPAYWYPGAALGAGIMFGIGVGIVGGLWGDWDWGGGDINIDVDRYNNFERNVNREANRGDRQANRDTRRGERQAGDNKFRHDSAHREGTPYRDQGTRDRFEGQRQTADNRFRGDDAQRSQQREQARQSMDRAGMERPARSNADAQNRARATASDRSFQNRQSGSPPGSGRDSFQQRGQSNMGSRDAARNSGAFNTGSSRGDAFSGASGGMRDTSAASSRGRSSSSSMSRGGGSYGGSRGGGASRSMSRPPVSRGGGGRRR
ncbi:DUF3300 domain-containing protein [Lysobacter sp. TY2-98]|nr:DUF3300 domain-containing protein [Lysobacter sp. TY2-98]